MVLTAIKAALCKKMSFSGYATLFNLRDAGGDIIRPGAFLYSLRKLPLPLYWQHRPDVRIGWVTTAREDAQGLLITAQIDDRNGGAAAALADGKVTGLSFGYRAIDFSRTSEGRELKEIELFEVSLVTNPMQAGCHVTSID